MGWKSIILLEVLRDLKEASHKKNYQRVHLSIRLYTRNSYTILDWIHEISYCFYYPTLLLPDTFINRHFYCPTLLLPDTFITCHVYYPTLLLSDTFITRHFYCPTLLLLDTFITRHF